MSATLESAPTMFDCPAKMKIRTGCVSAKPGSLDPPSKAKTKNAILKMDLRFGTANFLLNGAWDDSHRLHLVIQAGEDRR